MFVSLIHGSGDWLIAGIVAFIGIMFFGYKVVKLKLFDVAISIVVWYIVYKLHGNNTAVGAMTATVTALLFDAIGLNILKFFARR